MSLRIYSDTSVIGGCLDPEFEAASRRLFDKFIRGEAVLVISDLTVLELQLAPALVRQVIDDVPIAHREHVHFTEEAGQLAEPYIAEGAVNLTNRVDAQHIAVATINRVDVLVSWNFKHIGNLRRIRSFNAVNLKSGYGGLEIRTPLEVIGDEM